MTEMLVIFFVLFDVLLLFIFFFSVDKGSRMRTDDIIGR